MKKGWIFMPILFAGIAALVIWVVMLLWNALLPELFGISIISYCQAAGILLLSKILFGGFSGHHKKHSHCCHHKSSWKHKIHHKWHQMEQESNVSSEEEI